MSMNANLFVFFSPCVKPKKGHSFLEVRYKFTQPKLKYSVFFGIFIIRVFFFFSFWAQTDSHAHIPQVISNQL